MYYHWSTSIETISLFTMKGLKQAYKSRFLVHSLNFVFIFGYIIIPMTIRSSLWMQYELIFMNRISIPPFANLDNPIDFGLPNSYNMKITHDLCLDIGAWHILPKDSTLKEVNASAPIFGRFGPIVLYCHGNIASRAMYNRVDLYNFLAREGFEVVTYDYRGFADSPGNVSEVGVTNDTIGVYKYVLQHLEPGAAVYIWGHSLGSGIAIQGLYRILKEHPEVRMPNGLILECPFVNFREAVIYYPLYWVYRLVPQYSHWLMEGSKVEFDSDIKVPHISVEVPILIIHGEYDIIIPAWQGEALYHAANLSIHLQLGKPKCLKFGYLPRTGHNGGSSSFMMKEYLHEFIAKCDTNFF